LIDYFQPGNLLRKNHAITESAIPSLPHLRDAVRGQQASGGKIMKLGIAVIAALVGAEFSLMFSSRKLNRREPAPNARPESAKTPAAVLTVDYLFYTDPTLVKNDSDSYSFGKK
jgi:hypothetical protein